MATQMSDNQHKIKTAKNYNENDSNVFCIILTDSMAGDVQFVSFTKRHALQKLNIITRQQSTINYPRNSENIL